MNAKRILLDVLAASPSQQMAVRALVAAASLFDISENHLRVTLTRMREQGLLISPERGVYALGPEAKELAEAQRRWRHVLEDLVPWNGGWIAVHTKGLSNADRTAYRRQLRALGLCGFRALQSGFFVRPDNLQGGATYLRARLLRLGLDREAMTFAMRDIDPFEPTPESLWDVQSLDDSYASLTTALASGIERLKGLAFEDAAREAFSLGGKAIHAILFDPLLPTPMVDEEARRKLIEMTTIYDATGVAIWATFFGDANRECA